jgi:hypothetical protein
MSTSTLKRYAGGVFHKAGKEGLVSGPNPPRKNRHEATIKPLH